MKADKYLYVNGTSFATGWNKGFEDTYDVAPTFSWVTYLTESIKPKQLYSHTLLKGVLRRAHCRPIWEGTNAIVFEKKRR